MTGPMLTTSWRRGPTSSRYHPQDRRPDGDSGSWWQPALWARQRGGDWQPPGKALTFEADAGSERRNEGERTTLESWRWGYTPEVAEAVSGSRFRLGPGLEAEAIIAGSGSCDVWVVPGNPGTAGYYAVFVNALHEKLPDTRIICCSYRGHAFRKDLEGNGGVYSLEEQMRHQKLLLTHFRGPDAPQKPLVLVGHSIGAHMCLELNRWLLTRPPPASTPSRGPGLSEAQAVVGIAPFLQLYKRPLSTFLTVSMLTWVATPMRALADAIVWLLPVAMRRWMFGAASGLHEAWAVGLLGDHLDGHQVTNTLAMGRTELAALDKPVDWSEQQRLGRRLLHVFGRDDDYWAPLALRRSAQQQLPQAHIRHLPDMQHAFCTTLLEAQLVAENVAQFVSQVMPQPRSSSAVAADAAAPGC